MQITVVNRGPEAAPLHVLPTVWFRNTWSWDGRRPPARAARGAPADGARVAARRAGATAGAGCYVRRRPAAAVHRERDQHRAPVRRRRPPATPRMGSTTWSSTGAPTPSTRRGVGTKAAAHYALIGPGRRQRRAIRLRLDRRGRRARSAEAAVRRASTQIVATRKARSRRVLRHRHPADLADDARAVMRQALAGLLWTKQFYHYDVKTWLDGDPAQPPPPADRRRGRNAEWTHLYNDDVISMPDKWEYPWYAAWDLAFHCVPLALVDADFAKDAAGADAARVVHAPERAAAGLRVGLQRRQPAGARLGGVARLQDRRRSAAASATASSSSASSTSCC